MDRSGRRKEPIWVSSFRLLVANTTGVHTANNKTFTWIKLSWDLLLNFFEFTVESVPTQDITALVYGSCTEQAHRDLQCGAQLPTVEEIYLSREGDSKITGDPTHPHSPPALNWSPLADVTGLCTHTPQACWAASPPPQAVRLPNQWPPPVYLCIYSLLLFKFLLLLLNLSFFCHLTYVSFYFVCFSFFFLNGEPRDAYLILSSLHCSTTALKSFWISNLEIVTACSVSCSQRPVGVCVFTDCSKTYYCPMWSCVVRCLA